MGNSASYRKANREKFIEYNRRYREANREAVREANREHMRRYREANREVIRERDRQYYEANPEAGRERQRRYFEANREKVNEYKRQYREANPEAERERQRRWYEANREAALEHRRTRHEAIRAEVLAHYSPGSTPCCACCGTTGKLTIDHVNGDGAEHRAALFGGQRSGSYRFYAWLIAENFPPGYSVLCDPCNKSKGRGERCRLAHG